MQDFLKQNNYDFAVALDSDGATTESYLVHGIPTTVIIDPAGVIQNVFIGFGEQSEGMLDEAIKTVLGGK